MVELSELKQYLNIFHDEDDTLLKTLTQAGAQYIKDYTGMPEEELEEKANSIKVALMLIVSDLYDNRGKDNLQYKRNHMINAILDMNSRNLV